MTGDLSSCTLVVVTYNSAAVVAECLAPLTPALPAVVVDNASTDDTCALVARRFPDARMIANPHNEGFGRACNRGIRAAATPYVLLLNPDARMGPADVAALLAAAEAEEEAAILAPVVYGSDGEPQITYRSSLFRRGESGRDYRLPEGPACAEFLSGAALLLRREAVLAFGGFDPSLFLFYEDDDLCLQARRAGHSLIITPAARAVHAGAKGSAPGRRVERLKQWHFAWSRLYVEGKYRGAEAARRLGLALLARSACKAGLYALCLQTRKARRHMARAAGYLAWLRGQPAFQATAD